MTKKQKLELTWLGKEVLPKVEPRILLEIPDISFHASKKIGEHDIFNNVLIHGDNLLALKALENDFSGKVKCIYIDPPFNTGAAFEHYDDGVEHSTWLNLMHKRFLIFRNLLREDGVIFVHLDDIESAYAKVVMDEVFGRANYLNTINTTTNAASGFKATSSTIFSTANQIIAFAKNKNLFSFKRVYFEKAYDKAYSKYLFNRNEHYSNWKWTNLSDVFCEKKDFANAAAAKKELGEGFDSELAQFAIENASSVFRTAAIGGGAAIKRKETIQKSKIERGVVHVHPNEDVDNFYILNGEQFVFYDARLVEIDGIKVPGEIITDIWTDIPYTGIANEGAVEFKNGKKPEALLKRIFEMSTIEGDIVLDSFGGSGTTGAVAHKMGRRWIMVELGDHCLSHIIPRLQRIISGEDTSGVTSSVNWKGGGGFRYYKLAPSLLAKDKWDNWVINKDYDANMLAAAVCKHEGFTYSPSDADWWAHGYSTETDFIYVTTQTLTEDQLLALSEDVGSDRTLLVCCAAYKASASVLSEKLTNLTLKKMPNALLSKCEWGRDDYSLNISKLPVAEQDDEQEVVTKNKASNKEADLFSDNE
jgi:adenine-specific DNA-methyltransferase